MKQKRLNCTLILYKQITYLVCTYNFASLCKIRIQKKSYLPLEYRNCCLQVSSSPFFSQNSCDNVPCLSAINIANSQQHLNGKLRRLRTMFSSKLPTIDCNQTANTIYQIGYNGKVRVVLYFYCFQKNVIA